ncbi:MAG: LamG domain-containing protein [Methanobrevibacter sp.]|nr:LamG domain-containing protein [Methanobrevibacter sp.]
MSTTIPALDPCSDILDTDLILITHSNGLSEKTTGAEINKRHRAIIADSTTVEGIPIKTGNVIRIFFTAALTAANGSSTLTIKYNNVNYTVKVPRNGTLANYTAFDLGSGTYKYLQANTELNLLYDGTNLIILGNPLVLSDTGYSIFADGLKRVDQITENGTDMVTSRVIYSAIDKVNDIMGSLPTDAVLHYSFDEVPDYPDGTADVRLLDNNTYNIQSGNYKFINNGGATISNDNGLVKVVTQSGAGYYGVYIQNNYIQNKIIKIKIKVTELAGTLVVKDGNGQGNIILGEITAIGTYEFCTLHNVSADYLHFYIINKSNSSSATFTVEQIYIGDGSYSTPIIDNANGQNNAINNGGIATKGLSGKGLLGLGRKNIVTNATFPKPTDKSSITLSIWVKYTDSYNDTGTRNLFGTGSYNGSFLIMQSYVASQNSMRITAFIRLSPNLSRSISVYITRNEWHNAMLVWENKTLTFYVDGKKYTTSALDISDFTFGGNNWRIGDTGVAQGEEPSVIGTIEYCVDDAQIFDRALTETEVTALYLNKANTPKYYSWADWKLSQSETIQTRNVTPTAALPESSDENER